jgi:2'-5' RNA ligase
VSTAGEVRAFVALELDARVRESIGELQARLRPRLGGIRLVRPEGIHLTLRFLGATSPDQVETLRPLLAAAAAACPPADVLVAGLGTFPERGSPRVLWLGLDVPAAVLDLQRAVERAARAAGFEREERPFRAHLTLGRWRDRAPRPELPLAELGPTRPETLVLFRSDLRPEGAVYAPMAVLPLGRSLDVAAAPADPSSHDAADAPQDDR